MVFVIFLFVKMVVLYNNGVGKTPAMGWNSCESLVLEVMKGMQKYGLDKIGYKYINLDDCWQLEDRDAQGNVVPDPVRFPNGILYLADILHKNGFKLGLYTDLGYYTCQHRAGSFGYFEQDAKQYAKWEIDYIKVDFCNRDWKETLLPSYYYGEFSKNINETGRPILFSICDGGYMDVWIWGPKIAQSWRTTFDIQSNFKSMMSNADKTQRLYRHAGNYGFNDPDMLEIGVGGENKLNNYENRLHFSLWSIMSSPLLLGNDVRNNITQEVLDVITNEEVIAVNQDELGKQGRRVSQRTTEIIENHCEQIGEMKCRWVEIWKRELSGNRMAVVMFNHADPVVSYNPDFADTEIINLLWKKDLDVDEDRKYQIRDIWNHKDLGVYQKEFSSPYGIHQHDIMMIIMTPA